MDEESLIYVEVPPKVESSATIQQAIECLQIVCDSYKLKAKILYLPKGPYYYANYGWSILVMDKKFHSQDIVQAVGKAVEFVYNAHEQQDSIKLKT